MATGTVSARHYPFTSQLGAETFTFRLMSPEDRDRIAEFINGLPAEDLFYMMDDVRHGAAIDRWVQRVGEGLVTTVLAETGGKIVGYGSIRRGHAQWTSHLGEIRIMVAPAHRGKHLGKVLAKEVFAVANDLDLRRIVARLTSSQTPARYLFQHLGFHIEALLADCVIDDGGRSHDLVIMSYDVTGFHG